MEKTSSSEISHNSLRKYIEHLKESKNLSQETIESYMRVIKEYLDWMQTPHFTCHVKKCHNSSVDECALCSKRVCEEHSREIELNYLWHVCDACRETEGDWKKKLESWDKLLYEEEGSKERTSG
ncbi:hypothetical protein AKJ37_00755 [candidate division MSBL1 archaeon SCGC-AAA259I09]|uniref:Core-binding (CB) domain-containing protein n=1 Tax=candidate division MSBL1 archaeon SCGC-AAA259I09 TaxID=1698267 RepID=A0A133UVK7_9EURY|nr:hypothetical protein AKJ37_00755 [candidate division MSBL1 archaeon SCGC-AAA259I09]